MAFAQLPYRESLRDIEVCLRAQSSKFITSELPKGGLETPWPTAGETGASTPTSPSDSFKRVKFHDQERNKTLDFVTNDTTLPALTIALLYHSRWQVELFFKWIKQHLRIKSLFGVSEYAVKTQIWIAVSYRSTY